MAAYNTDDHFSVWVDDGDELFASPNTPPQVLSAIANGLAEVGVDTQKEWRVRQQGKTSEHWRSKFRGYPFDNTPQLTVPAMYDILRRSGYAPKSGAYVGGKRIHFVCDPHVVEVPMGVRKVGSVGVYCWSDRIWVSASVPDSTISRLQGVLESRGVVFQRELRKQGKHHRFEGKLKGYPFDEMVNVLPALIGAMGEVGYSLEAAAGHTVLIFRKTDPELHPPPCEFLCAAGVYDKVRMSIHTPPETLAAMDAHLRSEGYTPQGEFGVSRTYHQLKLRGFPFKPNDALGEAIVAVTNFMQNNVSVNVMPFGCGGHWAVLAPMDGQAQAVLMPDGPPAQSITIRLYNDRLVVSSAVHGAVRDAIWVALENAGLPIKSETWKRNLSGQYVRALSQRPLAIKLRKWPFAGKYAVAYAERVLASVLHNNQLELLCTAGGRWTTGSGKNKSTHFCAYIHARFPPQEGVGVGGYETSDDDGWVPDDDGKQIGGDSDGDELPPAYEDVI